MILADALTKFYGKRRALDAVSFTIERGEVVGFLGPNGAGKTTLLKLLSGATAATAGVFSVAGYSSQDSPQEIRRQVGFLPDRPPLYDEMRVGAMLRFGAQLRGLDRSTARARVEKVIEQCALTEVRDDPVRWLSHGYRQRVGIALAIVHSPALVILDEPINGLDPQQIRHMRQLVRELAEEHTVLLSSHILAEVEHTCDRLLILNRGRVVAQGSEAVLRQQLGAGGFVLRGRGEALHVQAAAHSIPTLEALQLNALQDDLFELTARGDAATRAQLVAALVERGLAVEHLSARGDGDLEALFLGLTTETPETP